MKRTASAACAALGAAIALSLAPASADTVSEPVLKTELEGMPGTEANIVVFDVDPDWETEHHYHPGHVFVYVIEGTVKIDVDGEDPVEYSAGEAFYERPNISMVGSNASTSERAKIVVFQVGEAGKPLMVAN
ncbi:cupin domain-containing protein [Leisingera sp. ANG59]|uniref:cupin domain-containing protein n=1 Tax=Leisingera sp. ANG59 TaxID=2675221 RepID=UPI0015748BA0|nr:cupin domain-containing protein [Leisingera sp. ANG59]NSY38312.1 cupin domain-containing protein [Leisingera sp. ANG59]